MQTSRFESITSRFSRRSLRTSFRRRSSSRSSQMSSSSSNSDRSSLISSPISTVGSIVFNRKVAPVEEDELNILEPRPAAYFCSLEEQMEHMSRF